MPIPPGLTKMRRSLARDEVYRTLHEWIVDGTLRPGEQVRDTELAARLGISRTPVREALRRLEDEALVQTQINRWTRVAPVDAAAQTHFPIIWALERLAIEVTTARFEEAELAVMAAANAEIARALSQGAALEASTADHNFHRLLTSRCGNPVLEKIIADQRVRLRRFSLRYFGGNLVAERSVAEHQAILDALRAEDYEGAAQAVADHWQASYRRQVDQLALLPDPTQDVEDQATPWASGGAAAFARPSPRRPG